MERFDVIVVGARCAGSPLATWLAEAGLRVCLLDRARFPSDTASTHLLQPRGVDLLERLGLLPALAAAGAAPIDSAEVVFDDVTIRADGASESQARTGQAEGINTGMCVRRVVLDALLVEAAAAAGVDVRTRTGVTGLRREGDRVTGVQTERGALEAAVVVGADGRHSTVAREVGAPEYHVSAPGRMLTWSYYEGVTDRSPRLRIGRRGDMAFLAAPTDAGLFMVGAAPSMTDKDRFLADRERNFTAALRDFPEAADLLSAARRVGPVRVVPDWYGYFRRAAGPGWVLTGDAGHFKDPTPGQGMSDALHHSRRLAHLITAHIGCRRDLDVALAEFWRWRDDDCYEMYWFAADMGAAGPTTPLIREVMRSIARDQRASADLLAVLNRELPPSALFSPSRVAKAFGRQAVTAPTRLPGLTREFVAAARAEIRRARQRREVGRVQPPLSANSAPSGTARESRVASQPSGRETARVPDVRPRG